MRGCLLIVCLILFQPIAAQENVDSLRQIWENTELSDSLRLEGLNKLAWDGYLFTQPDSAYYYSQLQFQFAKERGLKKEMAVALNTLGNALYKMGNFAKAAKYFYQSLKIKEEIKDTLAIAASLNSLGILYDDQGMLTEADKKYTRAMELVKSMRETSDDPEIEKSLAYSYNNLGTLNTESNPELAIVYFIKTLNITAKLGLIREQAYALNNIANVYSDRNEKAKALEYYQEALATMEKLDDHEAIADAINNIGIYYLEEGNYRKSISFAQKALNKAQTDGLNGGISTAAEILYESYKSLGNYQKALAFYELHIQSRDSIKNELNKREVIIQGLSYNYDKQAAADSIASAAQQEIQNIKIAEQEAQLKSEQTQRFLLYGVLAMFFVLIIVIYRSNRIQAKASKIIADQKEEVEVQRDQISNQHTLLKDQNKEITRFNENLEELVAERTKELEESLNQIKKYQHDLAHNIRAPYVTLMGLINLIKDERFDSTENKMAIQALRDTGDKIKLVLKDISKDLSKSDAEEEG